MSLRDDILHDCEGLCDAAELGYALVIKPQGSADSGTWITGVAGAIEGGQAPELMFEDDLPISEQVVTITITIPRSQLSSLGRNLMTGDTIAISEAPYDGDDWTVDQPTRFGGFEQPTCTRRRSVGGGYASVGNQ